MDGRQAIVAMSGGVDSSVAALLLKERGFDVTGLFLRSGSYSPSTSRGSRNDLDLQDARRVADQLGITLRALDLEADFGRMIDAFVAEYGRGRTPNPCLRCNRDLKFGRILDWAAADQMVATGHYARVITRGGRYGVERGVDRWKDQSYALFLLSQQQLERILLPLGEIEKQEVRKIARRAGLPVLEKGESQEICFVPDGELRGFLRERGAGTPGPILDLEGREVGRHEGVEFFTVGQRRGLGISAKEPLYVVRLEPLTATVRVGRREDLLSGSLVAAGWTEGLREIPVDGEELRARVQIRHRSPAARASLRGLGGGKVAVEFDEPQTAIAPGQAAVAYVENAVIGGGWIEGSGRTRGGTGEGMSPVQPQGPEERET